MTPVPGENPRLEGVTGENPYIYIICVTGARRTGPGNIEEPERKQRKCFITKNILLI